MRYSTEDGEEEEEEDAEEDDPFLVTVASTRSGCSNHLLVPIRLVGAGNWGVFRSKHGGKRMEYRIKDHHLHTAPFCWGQFTSYFGTFDPGLCHRIPSEVQSDHHLGLLCLRTYGHLSPSENNFRFCCLTMGFHLCLVSAKLATPKTCLFF